MKVKIIGGGLAGSEAAWQLACRGVEVELFEMRPERFTKAHKTEDLAELVCSNSFRGASLSNAVGLLKEELRRLDSLIMEAADFSALPAGGALAVDRTKFSQYVTRAIESHPLICVSRQEVTSIPDADPSAPVIVATGPLTSSDLAKDIEKLTGQGQLAFFDAIAPIILDESLDHSQVYRKSRYDKGGDDYLNIPFTEAEYLKFIEEVEKAEKYGGKVEVESDYTDNLRPFEGCMPIEEMISRGPETLRFGPLKPVGLENPRTGETPHAVMQLRMDDQKGSLWSMVGMQTKMTQGEQKRIFRSLPGLENAEFVRLGSLHRNSFINSPKCLDKGLQLRGKPGLYFAGQITGVEGYVESTAAGFVAGLNALRSLKGEASLELPEDSAISGLISYVTDSSRKDFQPMNISFGLMPSYMEKTNVREKKLLRRTRASELALESVDLFKSNLEPLSATP